MIKSILILMCLLTVQAANVPPVDRTSRINPFRMAKYFRVFNAPEIKLERTHTADGKSTIATLSLSRKKMSFGKEPESVTVVVPASSSESVFNPIPKFSKVDLKRMYVLLGLERFYYKDATPFNLIRLYKDKSRSCFAFAAKCLPFFSKDKVRLLDLRKKGLNDKDLELLSAIIPQLDVTSVNLAGNKIGNEGAKALASKLKGSKIIFLDLSNNRIGKEGMDALGESLIFSEIQKLRVKNNLYEHLVIPLMV